MERSISHIENTAHHRIDEVALHVTRLEIRVATIVQLLGQLIAALETLQRMAKKAA